jgi:hypothetical protein
MRQSGLTPNTIKQLKIKDVEKILEPDTPRPRKINLPQEIQKDKFGKPPTFIEEEAINYLKQYLASRTNPTGEDPLFITYSNPPQKINTHNASKTFRIQAERFEKTKTITLEEIKKGKLDKLKLYDLVKFYRDNTKDYIKEVKKNLNKDDEFFRNLYEKIAKPNLEIEVPTKTKINQIEKQLALTNVKIEKIENILMPKQRELTPEEIKNLTKWTKYFQNLPKKIEKDIKFAEEHKEELKKKWEEKYNTEEMREKSEKVNKYFKELKKQLEESPEEQANKYFIELGKRLDEHPEESGKVFEEFMKYLDEHPEIEREEFYQDVEIYMRQLEEQNEENRNRINELEKTFKELKEEIKKNKET